MDTFKPNVIDFVRELLKTKYEITALANITSAIKKYYPQINWVGFYYCNHQENHLLLGPFQGEVACEIINKSLGVCGTSWQNDQIVVAPDVSQISNYIACDQETKSEMVIPIHKNHQIYCLLDLDSNSLNYFQAEIALSLKIIAHLIEEQFKLNTFSPF
ncbi:MAG: GAF domain-containing protein [Acholeplasmatales bacterium]|jgi:GAF domain-containing protein|nr:GAF domain-containing protein [Acholeplasmatales bacterium]